VYFLIKKFFWIKSGCLRIYIDFRLIMSKRGVQTLWLILLCGRITFIFCDAVNLWNLEKKAEIEIYPAQDVQVVSTHNSADVDIEIKEGTQVVQEKSTTTIKTWNKETKSEKTPDLEIRIQQSKQLDSIDIEKVSLETLSSKIANKIEILETLYQKTKDEKVLKVLIDNLLSEYQFEKVREYLSEIDIFSSQVIDKQSYIYTYLNTLSVTDPNSMEKFIKFIEQLKWKSLISSDEYLFYKWLEKIWNKDYDVAIEVLKQISNSSYSSFTNQLESTVKNYNNQKWMPSYYEDALVSLIALKNGYFSIANKLAVYTILEDNDYILPYQVLAYSNFLIKNWDKAISYFYDLSSLDIENKNKYDFYLWISYYRKWEYENSVTTLYQLVNDSTYKTDVYRYLLLDYEQLDKTEKMVQIWQKLLWQHNLTESDFKYFYDMVFFKPFSKWEKSIIYENYKEMSCDMVSMCYDKFGFKNDTCIYWEVWFNIVNWLRSSVEESLLYLAESYPQASIYQALWDYYKKMNQKSNAKSYYIKAIALSDDTAQKTNIQNILLKLMN